MHLLCNGCQVAYTPHGNWPNHFWVEHRHVEDNYPTTDTLSHPDRQDFVDISYVPNVLINCVVLRWLPKSRVAQGNRVSTFHPTSKSPNLLLHAIWHHTCCHTAWLHCCPPFANLQSQVHSHLHGSRSGIQEPDFVTDTDRFQLALQLGRSIDIPINGSRGVRLRLRHLLRCVAKLELLDNVRPFILKLREIWMAHLLNLLAQVLSYLNFVGEREHNLW
mmetsp:Transcript_45033/g.82311  ORF Transcript_45033/g.82311 Transcript_45033/m.82311 type:complete len:219 (+) Transcript_45033:565-1221(+)